MALDTRDKRASALSRRRLVLPESDGAVGATDRPQVARVYKGLNYVLVSLDTRDKRASVIGLRQPWRQVLPNPAGDVINAYDREQLTGLYRDEEQSIAAASKASSSLSATLTTEVLLAAAGTAVSTLTGQIGDQIALGSSLAALSTVAGALTTGIRLQATLLSSASAVVSFNRAPVYNGLPINPSFINGTPSSFSTDGFFTDPDGDPLYIGLSPGPVWPIAGITYSPAAKLLSYDGTDLGVAPGETYSLPFFKLVADDGFGFSTLARTHTALSGPLTGAVVLEASAFATASIAGLLTTPEDLVVFASATANLNGVLTVGAGLFVLAEGLSSVSATLTDTMALAATIQGNSLLFADMGGGQNALEASLVSLATGVVDLTTEIRLVALAQATASMPRAVLGPNPILFSSAQGLSSISAQLTAPGRKGAWEAEDAEQDGWVKELELSI